MTTTHCNCHQDCFVKNLLVKNLTVSSTGFSIKSKWLAPFNFVEGGEASMLLLPNYLVITDQPVHRQQLAAIQELQLRQDELKQDFTSAVQRLANDFEYKHVEHKHERTNACLNHS